ncbi:MAG TPA: serine hydrolase domain-containing protein [Acidimicrobiales bacterium]|nr:serine hydrolase domain-containing protein [Acidimicrobiales bacterium]
MTEIGGIWDARFAPVRDAFASNFDAGIELGAALSISVEGRNVVDIWGGYRDPAATEPWDRDTLACIFSCTKGVVAVLALALVDRGLLDLDAPVADYWPEFAQAGKGDIPVRWLLTHQAGVSAIEREMPFGSLSDWDAMITALAEQRPMWTPGTGHGYHGVTYGHLVGEVIRRVTGESCGAAMRRVLCEPLGLDIWMPLPEHEESRTAEMTVVPPTKTFFDHWKPDGLGPKSFRNPPDCSHVPYTNTRAFRAAEIPAANGHGTARSLDRLYAALACGGALDGVRVLSTALVHEGGKEWVRGQDLVMDLPTAFGLGFERTIPEWQFGPNPNTYGHNGSGGSLGIVDPDTAVSLGYVMNRMYWGATRDDPRWPAIFDALYSCL